MAHQTLQSLLRDAAARGTKDEKQIIVYPLGSDVPDNISYHDLLKQARCNSLLLRQSQFFSDRKVVIIHLDNHLDNIIWFWSVLLANGLPAMSLPMSRIEHQRHSHINHLVNLFDGPIWLTRKHLQDQLDSPTQLNVQTVEELTSLYRPVTNGPTQESDAEDSAMPEPNAPAFLMLTSGSTGHSKAVVLTHAQVSASITGKLNHFQQRAVCKSWLNWIGFDHVAAVEAHLKAMSVVGRQVHVMAADIVSDPPLFLKLIDRHRIANSFAPNFLLSKLYQALQASKKRYTFNLESFKILISGGEANDVSLCIQLSKLLQKFGAAEDIICPAFGMTETFAGSITNLHLSDSADDPSSFAPLGLCNADALRMRIKTKDGVGSVGVSGELELAGPAIFKQYFNNPAATKQAFSEDGCWFKTGDQGLIDEKGVLHLTGRLSEVININGVKYSPQEIQSALEADQIPGVTPGYTIVFSFRKHSESTERVCVIFLPSYSEGDSKAALEANNAIIKNVMLQVSSRPYVLPLDGNILRKTSLGKLPRSKIKNAWLADEYHAFQKKHEDLIRQQQSSTIAEPTSELETIVLDEVCSTLGVNKENCNVESPLFDLGITSLETLALKTRLEQRLEQTIEIGVLLQSPTIRSLAQSLAHNKALSIIEYSPVVVIQPHGNNTPIWLIHPGVGDILVFLDLARRMDRPVYALRCRGFAKGETCFESIQEMITMYRDAIKRQQPDGPYAFAGYCYGAMVAFETAKLMEKSGDEVRFVGSIDLPPHIAWRMRQLDWEACLSHLAFFTGLLDEEYSEQILPSLRQHSNRLSALEFVIGQADPKRWKELALTKDALMNWVDVAYELHVIAWDYEPEGLVGSIDVFYAEPLRICATTKQKWVSGPLMDWKEFARQGDIRLHDCPGGHYTMIGVDYVKEFATIFKQALRDRGL